MAKKREPVRDYNFTDGFLVQLSDGVKISAERDTAVLNPRGVTALRLNGLQSLRDDFANYPTDEFFAGEQAGMTEAKDLARNRLTSIVRTVFTATENIFGVRHSRYKQLGDANLTRPSDDVFLRNAKNVHNVISKRPGDLVSEGITAEKISELSDLIKAFDDALDAQRAAQRERDAATVERVEKGNALYRELVKICNTGKDVWYEVNEARYNDYVIYNTASGLPENTGTGNLYGKITDGAGQPVEGAIVIIKNTELTDETDADGDYAIDAVPVGKYAVQVTADGFEVYTDDVVEIF